VYSARKLDFPQSRPPARFPAPRRFCTAIFSTTMLRFAFGLLSLRLEVAALMHFALLLKRCLKAPTPPESGRVDVWQRCREGGCSASATSASCSVAKSFIVFCLRTPKNTLFPITLGSLIIRGPDSNLSTSARDGTCFRPPVVLV
jgi:hypothetical protein